MTIVGSGAFTYEVVEPWPAAMLKYWSFESVVGVAVNSLDEVHVPRPEQAPAYDLERRRAPSLVMG